MSRCFELIVRDDGTVIAFARCPCEARFTLSGRKPRRDLTLNAVNLCSVHEFNNEESPITEALELLHWTREDEDPQPHTPEAG